MEYMENNSMNNNLAAQLEQVRVDMVEIASTGQYPVVILLRGYDLLEKLGDWENVEYNLQQYSKEDIKAFKNAVNSYREAYIANGEQLYAVMDMEQIRMKCSAYMSPWVRLFKEAKRELEKATALWEMAKVAHQVQQEGGLWEKWRTLRQVRKMAGFRLERKRTGNFVTRTFDLMQQAHSKAREAELKMYEHNVEYKCSPDTYLKIFELLNDNFK